MSTRTWIRRLSLLLIPPLLLAAIILNIVDSPALLPWLSVQLQQRMAGVKIDNASGTLQDGIHMDRLRIEVGHTRVVLDDVQAKVRWHCLLWGTVCVESLHARQLLINVSHSDKPAASVMLPALQTPIRLSWQQLAVDRLIFGDDANAPHLDAIRCSGSWAGSKLFIDQGQLQYLQSDIQLDGSIIFSGSYPLDIRTRVVNAKTGIQFSANIGGEVALLNAQLLLEQPVRAQGNAALSPLDPQLPYRARLSLLTPYLWRQSDAVSVTIADNAGVELHGDKHAINGELRAQADITGFNQPAQLNAPFQFDIATRVLTLSPQLKAGKTQLDGKAILTLADTTTLAATAHAQHINPGMWIAGYEGDIDANTTLTLNWNAGQLSQARGDMSAIGSIKQDPLNLRANGDWDRNRGWKLAQGEASAGKAKLRVSAQGRGTTANLQLAAVAPQVGKMNLTCDVDGIAEPTLRARCAQLAWSAPAAWKIPRWQNQSTLQLQWITAKKLATLAPFCLHAGAASICGKKESRWNNGELSATLKIAAIDLAWAHFWLPRDYALQGTLSGDINVGSDAKQATRWAIKLATHDARVTFPTGNHKTTMALQRVDARIDRDDARMLATVTAGAEHFGELNAQLTMQQDQRLEGRIALNNSSLAALQPFIPQVNIKAGTLKADIGIGGNRNAPSLHGTLQLQHGEISAAPLPWPVKNIDVQLAFEDRQATLQATAAVDEHPINASGEFDWQQALKGSVRLTTSELRVTPLPRTDLWISPDLTATLQDGNIDIGGRIDVPRAYIIIKELPKSGVAVSRDVVIVSDNPATKNAVRLTGNIDVALGDAVSFRGFGLQTRLAGRLALGFKDGQPTGNGRVQLLDGRYRAYGQLLDIRNGDLIFVGSLDNPVIRIEAIRSDVPEPNVVGVRVNGELRNPDIALFSTPAMSERARLQYLLTGRAPDSTSETDSSGSMLGQALLAFGAGESEGVVAGVADKFGVHDVSLSTAEGTTGTQVQLSAYLNSRLFLRYGKSVFDNANEITMRYQLTKSLFVEAVSGVASALDLLWSLEFGRDEEE